MRLRTTTTPTEAAGIVVLCFGWFIVGSAYAVSVGFKSGAYSLGAIYVGAFGLVLSLSYVVTGKLFPAVLAHAVADIVPFVLEDHAL
jgi:membrane protease YdiL (CAAX protease family)